MLREINTCHTEVCLTPARPSKPCPWGPIPPTPQRCWRACSTPRWTRSSRWTPQQNIILYNRAAERIFGWRREDVLRQPLDKLIPGRFRAEPLRPM